MKTFKEYLNDSRRTYPFRIKLAGDITTEQEARLNKMLERFAISQFKKVGKTPIQALPLDFPKLKNCEVSVYEVQLNYPTTPNELKEYLTDGLEINRDSLVVRNPNEPTEEYQRPHEPREGALLDDVNYSEAPNADFNDYYGSKYNASFIKEITDTLKEKQKARGEERPTGDQAEESNKEFVSHSPLQQAPDPRRKK